MTAGKALEARITRRLLARRASAPAAPVSVAERCIALVAATAGVFLLASLLQELLWALLAGATVWSLGVSDL